MDLRRRISQALAGAGAALHRRRPVVRRRRRPGGAGPGGAVGRTRQGDHVLVRAEVLQAAQVEERQRQDRQERQRTRPTTTDSAGTTDTTRSDPLDRDYGDEHHRHHGADGHDPSPATTAPPADRDHLAAHDPTAVPGRRPARPRPDGPSGRSGDSSQTSPQQVEPGTDPSTDTTTAPSNRRAAGRRAPPTGRRPARARGLPPGIYPVGPGPKSVGSTPTPTIAPAPIAAGRAPSQPGGGVRDAARRGHDRHHRPTPASPTRSRTTLPADSDVGGTELDRGDSPAPGPPQRPQLGQTGDGTRRLSSSGGVAMLARRRRRGLHRPGPAPGRPSPAQPPPGRPHRPRPRRELDGWEESVPLAPAKRELARHRLGMSARRLRASRRRTRSLIGVGPIENASRIFRSR